MSTIFRIMGRFAGHAMRSHAINMVVNRASRRVYREMLLADIKIKLGLLRRKRTHHLHLLGRTVYRLASSNNGEPFDDTHTSTITRVLCEIDLEIDEAAGELERRKTEQVQKAGKSPHS
ncbi:hypothetical protein ACFL5H_01740 [Candidatus Latescibacterota bacterium]